MSGDASNKFRAVIVGAGPVGLTAGHALLAAGIDFVILERQAEVVRPVGAALSLHPQTSRVLDQLGLYEDMLRDAATPYRGKTNVDARGRAFSSSPGLFEVWEQNHGYKMLNGSRRKFLDVLYRRLPQDRVKPGKVVIDIQVHDAGVRVLLEDGSVEEGSIVIGADGVNSKVRGIVQKLASAAEPNSEVSDDGGGGDGDEAEPTMVATYQSLLGTSKPSSVGTHVPRNWFWELRSRGRTAQVWSSEEEILWIVFRELPAPSRQAGGRRYTEAEAEAAAASCADLVPVPGVPSFRDLWGARTWCRLADQEEGFYGRPWHGGGRAVLAGDCVHKMTSNAGFGLNTGVQGVVSLANGLRACLAADPRPGAEALGRVFARYQADCAGAAREAVGASRRATEVATWKTRRMRIMDRYVAPRLGGDKKLLPQATAAMISSGRILDFIDKDLKRGRIPWKHEPRNREKTKRTREG